MRRLLRVCVTVVRRVAWIGAAATAVASSSPTLPATPDGGQQAPVAKSIPDRIKAVRERVAQDKRTDKPVLYRLSQFFNFPNFPNFPNFRNFPNFPNFPKF